MDTSARTATDGTSPLSVRGRRTDRGEATRPPGSSSAAFGLVESPGGGRHATMRPWRSHQYNQGSSAGERALRSTAS